MPFGKRSRRIRQSPQKRRTTLQSTATSSASAQRRRQSGTEAVTILVSFGWKTFGIPTYLTTTPFSPIISSRANSTKKSLCRTEQRSRWRRSLPRPITTIWFRSSTPNGLSPTVTLFWSFFRSALWYFRSLFPCGRAKQATNTKHRKYHRIIIIKSKPYKTKP